MHKKHILLIALLAISIQSPAQIPFSGEQAKSYIDRLCEEEFRGRKTGLPGAREAAEWIAGQFESWGLEPGAGDSYIQEFPMLATDQVRPAVFQLRNGLFGPVTYQQGNDFTVYFNSGSGNVTAEVVFAGFGISEPDKGWDDYQGVDVRGKVLLLYRGTPEDGQDWTEENERHYKIQTAAAHGAAALLILEQREWAIRGGTIHEKGYHPRMPALAVSRKTAFDLFQGTFRNMDYILRDLRRSPQSFAMGKTVHLQLEMKRVKPGSGENVVAVLPGNDPVLRNEFIVIGGHMDHNGVDPQGRIYAGADDNASGTAVVMELARTLALEGGTRRSLVFVAFGGEEQGLLGSSYYADHPTVSADRIAAMLNFDMTGTGDGGAGFGGRNYFPGLIDAMRENLPDDMSKKLRISRGWGMGGSDHAHYIEQGIPSFGFFSTGGHPFYHRLEDLPRTINVASLQFVGDAAGRLILTLADHESTLLFGGSRQGRCFLLFGDQIAAGTDLDIFSLNEKETAALQHQADGLGIRCLGTDLASEEDTDLYGALRRWDQFINGQDHFIFYQPGVFGTAATSDKLSLAIRVNARQVTDAGIWGHLTRLGVHMLQIDETEGPLFEKDGLSDLGKAVLDACKQHHVLLIWSPEHLEFFRLGLPDYAGPVLFPMDPQAALDAEIADCFFESSRRLLMVQVGMNTNAESLCRLTDRYGIENVHIDFSGFLNEEDESSFRSAWDKAQKLYEKRLENDSKKKVYTDMTALMGGNLNAFLRK
ncbi:MAG TPA: M20/M25/M40 family metallo-hydrolase [bacterium]|nr:M20/M25/M40 family metallo-hydrolase [bacterium]